MSDTSTGQTPDTPAARPPAGTPAAPVGNRLAGRPRSWADRAIAVH